MRAAKRSRRARKRASSSTSSTARSGSIATRACTRCRERLELKLFTAQSDLVNDKIGAIRFFADGGSNGGRVTIAAGERKYEVDVDWLTGRVAILD